MVISFLLWYHVCFIPIHNFAQATFLYRHSYQCDIVVPCLVQKKKWWIHCHTADEMRNSFCLRNFCISWNIYTVLPTRFVTFMKWQFVCVCGLRKYARQKGIVSICHVASCLCDMETMEIWSLTEYQCEYVQTSVGTNKHVVSICTYRGHLEIRLERCDNENKKREISLSWISGSWNWSSLTACFTCPWKRFERDCQYNKYIGM